MPDLIGIVYSASSQRSSITSTICLTHTNRNPFRSNYMVALQKLKNYTQFHSQEIENVYVMVIFFGQSYPLYALWCWTYEF